MSLRAAIIVSSPALPLLRRASLGALIGVVLAACTCGPARAEPDPGLVLELDRARFELRSYDARTDEAGPSLRIVLGSPANETPDGDHRVGRVILNPAWHPSDAAREAGAEPMPPSLDSPMGVAKIPFARTGSIALHGGGDLRLLGKPISGGCVRARDADLLRVLAWLAARDALAPPVPQSDGEVHRSFQRPVHLRIHSGTEGEEPAPAS